MSRVVGKNINELVACSMKIAIDIRPLTDKHQTGVAEYIKQLLAALFELDHENEYILFANANKKQKKYLPNWNYRNVRFCQTRIPNKLLNISMYLFGWPKLDKLISKDKIDIFFFPNLNFWSVSKNVKTILTVHDLSFMIFPNFFNWKMRLAQKLCSPRKKILKSNKIITVSNSTAQDVTEITNIDPEKTITIPLGIDKNLSPITDIEILGNARQKYNLPKKFILYLGMIEPRKNIPTIIDAFHKLCEAGSTNIHLVIAGAHGWKYKKITKRVQNSKYKDRIHFCGYIDKKDKAALYSLAEIFVFPSFYEGFGLPPLEAMACGTPVITTNSSSLGEVVDDAAILVDPYNINDLYHAIQQILKKKELQNTLKDRGFKRIQQFSWRTSTENLLQLFYKTNK